MTYQSSSSSAASSVSELEACCVDIFHQLPARTEGEKTRGGPLKPVKKLPSTSKSNSNTQKAILTMALGFREGLLQKFEVKLILFRFPVYDLRRHLDETH
jgi:hypothetical protein